MIALYRSGCEYGDRDPSCAATQNLNCYNETTRNTCCSTCSQLYQPAQTGRYSLGNPWSRQHVERRKSTLANKIVAQMRILLGWSRKKYYLAQSVCVCVCVCVHAFVLRARVFVLISTYSAYCLVRFLISWPTMKTRLLFLSPVIAADTLQ